MMAQPPPCPPPPQDRCYLRGVAMWPRGSRVHRGGHLTCFCPTPLLFHQSRLALFSRLALALAPFSFPFCFPLRRAHTCLPRVERSLLFQGLGVGKGFAGPRVARRLLSAAHTLPSSGEGRPCKGMQWGVSPTGGEENKQASQERSLASGQTTHLVKEESPIS